ncbi:hypothetical protein F5Y12DRAFT_278269 [Xylaria sp. FL1777]|nr:hypothetical protein F5Y12DRAFT_278269 [Xylaria sp. FL1777]
MLVDPPPVEGASTNSYEKPSKYSQLQKEEMEKYQATIVDFYQRDGRVDLLRRSRSVFTVVYEETGTADTPAGPEGIMQKARSTLKSISLEAAKKTNYEKKDLQMRWIHLPANNMEWMEVIVD